MAVTVKDIPTASGSPSEYRVLVDLKSEPAESSTRMAEATMFVGPAGPAGATGATGAAGARGAAEAMPITKSTNLSAYIAAGNFSVSPNDGSGTYANAGNLSVTDQEIEDYEVRFNYIDGVWSRSLTSMADQEFNTDSRNPIQNATVATALSTIDSKVFPFSVNLSGANSAAAQLAIREIYIADYDGVNFDYYLRILRRSHDAGGGIPINRWEITIVKCTKSTTTVVETYSWVRYNWAEGTGLQLINLNATSLSDGNVYVAVDWSKFPIKGIFQTAGTSGLLSDRIGDYNASPFIKATMRFPIAPVANVPVPDSSRLINITNLLKVGSIDSLGVFHPENKAYRSVIGIPVTELKYYRFIGIGSPSGKYGIFKDSSGTILGTVRAVVPNGNMQAPAGAVTFDATIIGGADSIATTSSVLFETDVANPKISKVSGFDLNVPAPIDAYTKTETNNLLTSKVNATDIYNKAAADSRYQYKSDAAYTQVQSDSKYALIGSTTDSNYKIVDAADFGFLPSATASENVLALQAALDGGNKTITISQPGDYLLDDTVWIDDNTEIIMCKGAALKKDDTYWNMLCNRGAPLRQWNENITLTGIYIKVNGYEQGPLQNDVLYGLRGSVNLFYVKNVRINNIKCVDIGTVNWPLHICTWEDVVIDGVEFAGMKDGIHLGTGKNMRIYGIKSSCYDDTIGFNSFDYPQSNPEVGPIEDVYVENVVWTRDPDWSSGHGGRVFNFQTGTVGPWVSGMMIMAGDVVTHEGNTYLAIVAFSSEIESTIAPAAANFTTLHVTGEGITWRLQKTGMTTAAGANNVHFKNIVHGTDNIFGILVKYFAGTDSIYSRTVHPNIATADYPQLNNILFENVKTYRGYFSVLDKLSHKTTVKGLTGKFTNDILIQSSNTVNRSFWTLINNDFSPLNGGMTFGNNAEIIFRDNIQNASLNISSGVTGCRVNSNNRLSLSDPTILTKAIKGDEIIVSDGTKKIYNGSAWVNIN